MEPFTPAGRAGAERTADRNRRAINHRSNPRGSVPPGRQTPESMDDTPIRVAEAGQSIGIFRSRGIEVLRGTQGTCSARIRVVARCGSSHDSEPHHDECYAQYGWLRSLGLERRALKPGVAWGVQLAMTRGSARERVTRYDGGYSTATISSRMSRMRRTNSTDSIPPCVAV